MSGLEKFSRRESAICRLKQFLLQQRAPPSRESLNSSTESNENIQLDLDQSFQKILNAHRTQKASADEINQNKENVHQTACDNSIHPSLDQTTNDFKSATCSTMYTSMNDTTLLASCLDDSDSDISFNELERMCNKTLSDPNNTIHQYLTGQLQERGLGRMSNYKNESKENLTLLEAIDHYLDEERIASDEQLYDIEAPSYLWDNTIAADVSGLKIATPIKSVKFQSIVKSISEESLCDLADVTLNLDKTIQTDSQPELKAKKTVYETALLESESTTKNAILAKTKLIASDSPIPGSYKTAYETSDPDKENILSNFSPRYTTVQEKLLSGPSTLDSSVMFSALDGTFYVTPKRKSTQRILGEDCDLIDLEASLLNVKPEHVERLANIDKEDSIIYISDDEYEGTMIKDVEHSDLEEAHLPITKKGIPSPKSRISNSQPVPSFSEERREFNDTLEEVDFIMKQGIKYLAANPRIPTAIHSDFLLSPSPMSSPQTPNTVIKRPHTDKPALNVQQDEKPKREEFKRPRQFTRIPKPAIKNIVSPVGTYIRHTPTTPLMTSYKPSATHLLQSKTARGLKYDVTKEGCAKKAEKPVLGLPKKAYISSTVKHVVDERKAHHLPGGEKIHRHLVSAKAPTVIHHQGKIKSNENPARLPYEANSSLANLSTVSGDISLHVLKDARR